MNTDNTNRDALDKRDGLIPRLFRGDVELRITYWVFGVLIGNLGFGVLYVLIEENYLEITATKYGVWFLNGFYLFNIAYAIFILIAIWRSAGRYDGRAIWSGLARVYVVFATLSLVGAFINGIQQDIGGDAMLDEEIRLINNSLPKMLDDLTRLDIVSRDGKDIFFSYTLVDTLAGDIDIPTYKTQMVPDLKTTGCEDEYFRALLDQGRKIHFIYRDKETKPIAKIIVDKSDCVSENGMTGAYIEDLKITKPHTKYKPSDIFTNNNEAIVLIRTYDESGKLVGFGSGFNVHENGLIITNLHVIMSGGSYIDIKFPKHGTYEDVYIAGLSDISTDMAVLWIDGRRLPFVNIEPSVPLNIGDRVYTISNPEGLVNSFTDGLVSAKRVDNGTTLYQITAPISEGSSGGAVFNEYGEVIGVATLVMAEGQSLNFAVSIEEFEKIEAFDEFFTLKALVDYFAEEDKHAQ